MDTQEKIAKLLLEIKAVTFRFKPPYTYTSGLKSPIYLDNRIVMSFPRVRKKIVDAYIKVIREDIGLANVDWISATATAAIPQGAWVAERLQLPMVYVRPTSKKYGKGTQIEGYVKKGSKVLIIEDHISTGGSAVGNVNVIRKAGGVVKYCVATTTYETKTSIQLFSRSKVKLLSLTSGTMIVEMARKEGLLTSSQFESVMRWFNDPQGWTKK